MTEGALEPERQRRARLANMLQELLAPVTALVGYGEMLIEKARGLKLEGCYDLEARGLINLRGIGKIRTAFLTGRKGGVPPEFLEHEQRVRRAAQLPHRPDAWPSRLPIDRRGRPTR